MGVKCDKCKGPLDKATGPETNVFFRPWYRDDQGINHSVWVCLKCGTVHDMIGPSLWDVARGRLMVPTRTVDVAGLRTAQADSAFDELGFPDGVVEVLRRHKFIS